jgi:hypothetical protein
MNFYFFYYDFKFFFNMILMSTEKKYHFKLAQKKMFIKVKIIIFIYHSKHWKFSYILFCLIPH